MNKQKIMSWVVSAVLVVSVSLAVSLFAIAGGVTMYSDEDVSSECETVEDVTAEDVTGEDATAEDESAADVPAEDESETEAPVEDESTTEVAGDDETTTAPADEDESTTEDAGDDETTTAPADDDETTTVPSGEGDGDETTTAPADDDETTTVADEDESTTEAPVIVEIIAVDGAEIVIDNANKLVYIRDCKTVADVVAMCANEVVVAKADAESDFVGTSSTIKVNVEGGYEYTVVVKGDVDANGKITAADARDALRASAKLDTLEGVFSNAANADCNDKLSAADARDILRKSAQLDTLPLN